MQCVVFDMDGVLFDSEKLVLQCWEQTAQAHHIPDIQTACRSCLGSNAASARQKFLEKYGRISPMTPTNRRCPHGTGSRSRRENWN